MSSAEYHALDAVSNSRLSKLRQSPAHLRYAIANPPEQTDALRLGSATHCAILEPDLFSATYAIAPKCDRRTTKGKEEWAAFLAQIGDRVPLTMDEYAQCTGMYAAVHSHDAAAALVGEASETEITGCWEDSATGLLCKMRIDAVAESTGTLFDIKTTRCASRRAFEKSIFEFGYHRQAAMYLDGMAALGRKFEHFAIIAVEKEPPYALAVYRILDDVVELGRKEIRPLMQLYKRCLDSHNWPGYPQAVQDISIPAWAIRQIEEDVL